MSRDHILKPSLATNTIIRYRDAGQKVEAKTLV